jgi:hypothetical protein
MNQRIDMRFGRSRTAVAPLASPAELGAEQILEEVMNKQVLFLRPFETPVLGQKQLVSRAMFPGKN